VLGTTTDELSPATRNLLSAIHDFCAKGGSRFTRRALRDATGLGDSQLKVHLSRLVDLEYVATERAGPSTSYELVADADHAYGSDRPGQRSYRPGENSDRPVIGRFGSHRKKGSNPQPGGTVDPPGDQSGGIGRFEGETEKPLSARDNLPPEADRPGLRQIHGTGTGGDEGVVVDRARVGGS